MTIPVIGYYEIARNLTDTEDGLLKGKRYLIHDRDPLFTAEFLSTLSQAGTESVKLPPRSPNLNSYAERFVRTLVRILPRTNDPFPRRIPADGGSGIHFPLSR